MQGKNPISKSLSLQESVEEKGMRGKLEKKKARKKCVAILELGGERSKLEGRARRPSTPPHQISEHSPSFSEYYLRKQTDKIY